MMRRIFMTGFICMALIVLAMPFTVSAEEAGSDGIALLKALPVSRLDALLPEEPFGEWFSRLMGEGADIRWESNDCGEQTGDPAVDSQRDIPVCVQATALFGDGMEIGVMVRAGSVRKGMQGEMKVAMVYIKSPERFLILSRLADLTDVLRR